MIFGYEIPFGDQFRQTQNVRNAGQSQDEMSYRKLVLCVHEQWNDVSGECRCPDQTSYYLAKQIIKPFYHHPFLTSIQHFCWFYRHLSVLLDFNAGLHSRSPTIVINMDVRLPSLSTSTSIPLNGFAICNSLGRRVSLLNDDEPISVPPYIQPSSPQQYPLSPAYSSDSDHDVNRFSYYDPSPPSTSPSMPEASPNLPSLDLISFNVPNYDPSEPISRKTSFSSVSGRSRRGSLVSANGRMTSSQSNQSRCSKRRYECATCRKTFTTSGHVARHNRIHTGEKNFQCPEPGCLQRFSRQDNCMYGPVYLTAD